MTAQLTLNFTPPAPVDTEREVHNRCQLVLERAEEQSDMLARGYEYSQVTRRYEKENRK